MIQELITTDRLEYLCHKSRCEEFAQIISEMGYRPVSVVFGTIGEKIASIDHQMIHSHAVADETWVRRATQARQIFERKRRACRERLDAIRSTALSSLGALDGVSSSRLGMIKMLLGVLDKYADSSKLSEEERSAINACRSAAGQTGDVKFSKYTYYPELNAILGDDRTEIAVVSRHGYDREEIGNVLAASTTLLGQVKRAIPSCEDRPLVAEMESTVRQLS